MTKVGLPDTSTYTTADLISCLVAPSACAYGSEGWGSNPFARATSQNSKICDQGFEATFATGRRGLSSAADPLTPPVSQLRLHRRRRRRYFGMTKGLEMLRED